MTNLTASELKVLIKDFAETKNPLSMFVVGDPGVGKSFSIREAAQELGRKYILLSLGRLEAYDVKGVPMAVDEKVGNDTLKFVKFIMPLVWAEVIRSKGQVIVHLDEFTLASPEVQSAVLDVIHEKKVDDVMLPESTMFVLSGNMGGDDGTAAQQVTSAITGGRVAMCRMVMPSVKEWVAYQKPLPRIAAFLLASGISCLYVPAKADLPWDPWTNPRTWSKFDELCKSKNLDLNKDEDVHRALRYAKLLHSSPVVTALTDYLKDSVIDPVGLFKLDATAWAKYKKAGGTQDFKRSEVLRGVYDVVYGSDSEFKDKAVRSAALQKFFEKLVEVGAGNGHADMINSFAAKVGDKDPATYEKITLKGADGKLRKIGEIFDSLLEEEETLKRKTTKK